MTGTNEENFDKVKKRFLFLLVLALSGVVLSQYMGWISLHKEGYVTISQEEIDEQIMRASMYSTPLLGPEGEPSTDDTAIYDDGFSTGYNEGYGIGFDDGYSRGLSDGSD